LSTSRTILILNNDPLHLIQVSAKELISRADDVQRTCQSGRFLEHNHGRGCRGFSTCIKDETRDADVFWGLVYDDSLGDKVQVTVVATGIDTKGCRKITGEICTKK
jgi:hypothetical protein